MWKTAYFCIECNHELSYGQKMGSHGRCPYCGHKGMSSGTIVDVVEKGYKLERINPVWKFWKPQYERIYR